jgi:hypothetical protein
LILGVFFAFLIGIGVENQVHLPTQIEAYRNDAYILRLRETLRREFLSLAHHQPGALDVRAENRRTRLKEIMDRLEESPPKELHLHDGPAGTGRLVGLGHPSLWGEAQKTIWLLVSEIPGGSLEITAIPGDDQTQSEVPAEATEEPTSALLE